MITSWKTFALILLCTVSFTGCTPTNNKEKASTRYAKGTVIHITSEQEFNRVIANGDVVVDFYASWCGPCQRMSPIIDELAPEMTDVTFVKLDTEKFDTITKKYNVRGLPTLIFFRAGQKLRQVTGLRSKIELRKEIKGTYYEIA